MNSVYVDEYINIIMFGKNKGNIVSPMKLGSYRKKYPFIFPFFYTFFLISVPLILFILNTIIFLRLLFTLLTKKNILFPKNIILLTDQSIIKTNDRLHLFDSYSILLKPFSKFYRTSKNKTIHSLSFLTFRILLTSYFFSLLSPFFIIANYDFKNILYSFNSFEWFLLFQILEKNISSDNNIALSNQKDRWAILVDLLSKGNKSIVQHGTNIIKMKNINIESFLVYMPEYKTWALDIPVKYTTINKLYAFNKIEADHVIVGEFENKPDVEYVGYNITINNIKRNKTLILLIGNIDVYYEIEKFIVANINNNLFDVVIKPHPLSKKAKYDFLNESTKIIDCNPNADIIISYESTLAHEYEGLGYKVYYFHDITSAESILDTINYII